MRVRSAHTERGNACDARSSGARPSDVLVGNAERRIGKVDRWVRVLEAHIRRDHLLAQGQRGLDHTSGTGGRCQVTDVALDRPDHTPMWVVTPGLTRSRTSAFECQRQCFHLDRITERRGGAVRLHVGDLVRAHTRIGLCHGDHLRLATHAGCGEARFVAAVVVQRGAFDGGVDLVVVTDGIFEALQHDDTGTVTETRAFTIGVEGARAAVGAVHATFVVHDAAVEGNGERDATGQRHVAFPIAQRLERLCDRHQRSTARGVDAQCRTAQIELEGEACGDVVLLIGGHHREVADLLDQLRMTDDVACEVGVVAHAGIDTDEPSELCGIVRGILQGGPGRFQEHALLRIHQCGHLGVHAEEGMVELVRIGDHTAGLHVVGIIAEFRRDARVELIHRPCADAVLLLEQVLPQLFHILRTRETTAHADNGDVTLFGTTCGGLASLSHFRWSDGACIAFQVCGTSAHGRVLIELHDRQLQAMTFELCDRLNAQQ